ncbi:MAG: DUF3427 domain-containing protein [Actinomycetota bacterium]|nr:DUF3427 domain-containing protein [Actinomycetota bacterium]
MDEWDEPGLWEELVTEASLTRLRALPGDLVPDLQDLRDVEAGDRLSRHIAGIVARLVDGLPEKDRARQGVAVLRTVIDQLTKLAAHREAAAADLPVDGGRMLRAIERRWPTGEVEHIGRPLTPLLDTTILTNAPGEPALAHELEAEVASAYSIDVIMAFIRRSGIYPLLEVLRRHKEAGRRLRVLTTTYTGSTEARALDDLAALGAEIKVSYDIGTTRLHAKAWLFHRSASTTTAYLGSSNLTQTAQFSGVEWNVRVSAARNPDVVAKMAAVFDSYWEGREFATYDPVEFRVRTETDMVRPGILLAPIELELRPFQEALLERIELARSQGHHRNLLVAATGTGKTVMAAVDYARLRNRLSRSRLLFVAHRSEILRQSQATFRYALRDGSFGELWVDDERPLRFDHVFASVQSLAAAGPKALDPHGFDVIVIDEFHHAAAPTYRALLDHLEPVELLGLTATPERADGLPILSWFDGRIAAELRLWDAIADQHLVPFAYYGIHDGSDLRSVPWRRGQGYDPNELTGLLTADHAWAHRILDQVAQKVTDPARMRALGFCVGVTHARFMAARFEEAGLPAVAITGTTPTEHRRRALEDLAAGRITAVFTVDLFNEGIDVPSVDTLLFLRPTESPTLFLQQLGRGLRRSRDKAACTVLDFVGRHRQEFRFDRTFRALLRGSRREVADQVATGFPYLPAGCSINLDPVAQDIILRSIREALPLTWRRRQEELHSLGDIGLSTFLAETGLDLTDIYANNHSWTQLRRAVGLPTESPGADENPLLLAVGRLLHVDDPERLAAYRSFVTQATPPDGARLPDRQQRLQRMLIGSLTSLSVNTPLVTALNQLWGHPQVRAELLEVLDLLGGRIEHVDHDIGLDPVIPLRVHARYTRTEILSAFGVGAGVKPPAWQEGVRWDPSSRTDLLAFTLDKTAGSFSPTTRYRDYALSPNLIHWESQSNTSLRSETGQRYVHHLERGTNVVLFARLTTNDRAFWCLGPATHVRHDGERPIAITWRLRRSLPADLYEAFAAAVA